MRTKKEIELSSDTMTLNDSGSGVLTKENINTLYQAGIIPKNTPKEQIVVFAHICQEHGLSPFSKEIYLLRYFSKKDNAYKYCPIIGIDGLRKKAAKTGLLAGIDPPEFNRMSDGTFQTAGELKGLNQLPISCFIRVWKMVAGQRVPFGKDVLLSEFMNPQNSKWKSTPFTMLTVVAEKHSLRQAFAAETSGLIVQEEMASVTDRLENSKGKDIYIEDFDAFVSELEAKLNQVDTLDQLSELYESDRRYFSYDQLRDMFEAKKTELINAQKDTE